MVTDSDFKSFISQINPSKTVVDEASRLHNNLRQFLSQNESYSSAYKNTYLSGSYAKHTFIRPKHDSDNCDIDVIVETTHSVDEKPIDVLRELYEALKERPCYKRVMLQSHSVGIEMANFHIDVVPLATGPDDEVYIGSKEDGSWKQTKPKDHISWSADVNREYDGNYKPLVKILKWWRRENCPEGIRFPKGITLEKMIADNLPDFDSGMSIEDLVMQSMANLAMAYEDELDLYQVPNIADPSIEDNNLAEKYTFDDFARFVEVLNDHLALLADEGCENVTWQKILGSSFPSAVTCSDSKSLAHKSKEQLVAFNVHHKQQLGYPLQAKKPNASITATATLPNGKSYNLKNDDDPVPKGTSILYRVNCGPVKDSIIKWRVTNTGEEAMKVCPRGGFERPNEGKSSRREETAYTGKHFVECFVIKRGACVRWTNPFFINVE